jgi:hypothetical protein
VADHGFRLDWDGDRIAAMLRGASLEGLELAAEHLLQVSTQLAPHEEGDLARSGEISTDDTTLAVAVSYDRPYAVVQHEDMTLQHDNGKTAKYLEGPMNEEAGMMTDLIASKPRRALG